MVTEPSGQGLALARLRLMQLVSPALPVGGFTYSQGMEYAIEAGWIDGKAALEDWLQGLIEDGLCHLDIPILARLYHACRARDTAALAHWGQYLLAARETAELRAEERQRARALTRLIIDLGLEDAAAWEEALHLCQLGPFALAAVRWDIPLAEAANGYAWSWLENMVAAAVKLVPLGQTDGQALQLRLAERVPAMIERALGLPDEEIGASAPRMAIASSRHERQYTRLFRS